MAAFGNAPEPVFRAATMADLDAIHALETSEFAQLAYPYFVLRQLYETCGADWTIAEYRSEVCGYVLTTIGLDGCAWFLGLAVAGYCRGRGYGRALLEAALEHCRRARADHVKVTVHPDNRAAYHLYKEVGFVRIDQSDNYFGADEPRDVLVRKLYH